MVLIFKQHKVTPEHWKVLLTKGLAVHTNIKPTTEHSPLILHIDLQAAPTSGTVSKDTSKVEYPLPKIHFAL